VSAIAMAASRLTFGLPSAASSRYVVSTAPTAIGLYLFFVRVYSESKYGLHTEETIVGSRRGFRRWIPGAAAMGVGVALLGAAFVVDANELQFIGDRGMYFQDLQKYACNAALDSDGALALFQYSAGDASTNLLLKEDLVELREAHLSVFSGDGCSRYHT
jgi:hypothetical protein